MSVNPWNSRYCPKYRFQIIAYSVADNIRINYTVKEDRGDYKPDIVGQALDPEAEANRRYLASIGHGAVCPTVELNQVAAVHLATCKGQRSVMSTINAGQCESPGSIDLG